MEGRRFQAGEIIVYCKPKYSTHPGRRARSVWANRKGDSYAYCVFKFWIVRKVLESGQLLVQTRRGKTHLIDPSDPNLRRPTLLQRIQFRSNFALLRADAARSS